MVDSMLKNCPSRISDSIECDVSNAIHRCNQTRRVKTNLLHNGIDRYLGISRRANFTGRDAWAPRIGSSRQANSRINRTKLSERLLALASDAGEILLAIGTYLRISRWVGDVRRRRDTLMS